jgi:tRNA modification GTPase
MMGNDERKTIELQKQNKLIHKKTIQKYKGKLLQEMGGDLLAMDIRQALNYLGEITGEITTDDLLGNIFSKFCIEM